MTSDTQPYRDGNLEYQHGVNNARGILYGLGFSTIIWGAIALAGFGLSQVLN